MRFHDDEIETFSLRERIVYMEVVVEGSMKDRYRIARLSIVFQDSRILIKLVFGEFFLYILSCVEMNNYLLREIEKLMLRYRIFRGYEILT